MKGRFTTFIFLCMLLLTACGTESSDNTNEAVTGDDNKKTTTTTAKEVKATSGDNVKGESETTNKELDTKSSELFDWFKESGLVRGEKEDVDGNATTDSYMEFKSHGVISSTYARQGDELTLQIIEFQTEDEAKIFEEKNRATLNGFLHEHIYIVTKANMNQMEQYIAVMEAGKPIPNIERSYYSDEHRQIHEALLDNDFMTIATVFSSIEDWQMRNDIFYDSLYMSEIDFESVYIGPSGYYSEYFGISPDVGEPPYNAETESSDYDGQYVVFEKDGEELPKNLEIGKKYNITGYFELPGVILQNEEDASESDYLNASPWILYSAVFQ